MTKAFKIVRKTADGNLLSYMAGYIPHELTLRYSTDEWTEAPHGGLLVFRNLRVAKAEIWGLIHQSYAIYLCECEEPVPLPDFRAPIHSPEVVFRAIWQDHEMVKRKEPWPRGTLAFKRVRLIKEVPCPTTKL